MTYVGIPTWPMALIASTVGCSSRQSSGPYGPETAVSQQFGAPFGGHPWRPSMLSMHAAEAHTAAELQFGPPSVARMTNVRPASLESVGTSAWSEAAVGVPPSGAA